MGSARVATGDTEAGDGYHVLVVDDNRALATVVAESLQHTDSALRTSYTTEPREALDRLSEGRVDCLVTDYEMPGIDGLSLVDRADTEMPFVVFTQRRDDGVASAVRERGGAYLPKGTGSERYHRLATLIHEQLGN